jgi:hypothetical protein
MAQAEENLPSKYEVLSSNHSTILPLHKKTKYSALVKFYPKNQKNNKKKTNAVKWLWVCGAQLSML